jgi:hypothetical protein
VPGAWIRSPVADSPDQVGAEARGSYGDGGDGVADGDWQEPERACGITSAMTAANPAPTAMRDEHSRRERGDAGDSTRTVTCGKSRANAASWPRWEPMTAELPTSLQFPLTLYYGV